MEHVVAQQFVGSCPELVAEQIAERYRAPVGLDDRLGLFRGEATAEVGGQPGQRRVQHCQFREVRGGGDHDLDVVSAQFPHRFAEPLGGDGWGHQMRHVVGSDEDDGDMGPVVQRAGHLGLEVRRTGSDHSDTGQDHPSVELLGDESGQSCPDGLTGPVGTQPRGQRVAHHDQPQ